jgi:hypothetical protein
MIRQETVARLEEIHAEVEIDDGGLLTAAVDDRGADLRVHTPGETPLSAGEPHAELEVSGADVSVTVELSGPQVEALLDALATDSDSTP